MNVNINGYLISDNKNLIQIDSVFGMLSKTYWAENRSIDTIQKSIENSLCFGIYYSDIQIGFARCFTDYAVTYYLCDVVVDEKFRGQGLGKALVKFITEHRDLAPLMGVLGTRDVHGLYKQFGFICDEGMYKPPVL